MEDLVNDKDLRFINLPLDIRKYLQVFSGCSLCRRKDKWDCDDLSYEELLMLRNKLKNIMKEALTSNKDKIRKICPDMERFPFLKKITKIEIRKESVLKWGMDVHIQIDQSNKNSSLCEDNEQPEKT